MVAATAVTSAVGRQVVPVSLVATTATSPASNSAAAATQQAAVAAASNAVEVDLSLEKALGIEFSDPNGVVQRQLLAK